MINTQNLKKCCGCGACANVCPVGAIKMARDAHGFMSPKIDESKCINCGLCERVCPVGGKSFAPESFAPKSYACYADKDTRMHSSSGGIFSLLANSVLNAGGAVCGAAFDSENLVEHIIIESRDNLDKLCRSKYLQSDTKSVFSEIKKLLDNARLVLFAGTPCQVAGLYGFLQHDYDNLLTTDVFCHGAPSPMVWKKYLNEIAENSQISDINFRDKSSGGCSNYSVSIAGKLDESLSDAGDKMNKKYILSENHRDNIYMAGFLRNLYLRKSCRECPFAKTPRTSDISLGDFWGANKKLRGDDTGLSAVLINTPKGQKFFNQIRDNLEIVLDADLQKIVNGNPVLKQPCITHNNSDKFWADFSAMKDGDKIIPLIEKHLGMRNVAIMNFSHTNHNYGAMLVAYAMENILRRIWYNPYTIHYVPNGEIFNATNGNVFNEFGNKFLNWTGICTTKDDLQQNILPAFDKYIVGSDQVFRYPWHNNYVYLLDWVCGKKTIISYAASFGKGRLEIGENVKYLTQCLSWFDALSVREQSGVNILNNLGASGICHIDPTLLLNAVDYQKIIDADNSPLPTGDYIATDNLDNQPKIDIDLPIVDCYRDDYGNYRSVGEWLNLIKNAKYVITDSFHGTVFSIIFGREFISITNELRGNERLDTLFDKLGIDKSQFRDKNAGAICTTMFINKIDYKSVYNKLELQRADAIKYLTESLAIAMNEKSPICNKEKKKSKHHSFVWHLIRLKF